MMASVYSRFWHRIAEMSRGYLPLLPRSAEACHAFARWALSSQVRGRRWTLRLQPGGEMKRFGGTMETPWSYHGDTLERLEGDSKNLGGDLKNLGQTLKSLRSDSKRPEGDTPGLVVARRRAPPLLHRIRASRAVAGRAAAAAGEARRHWSSLPLGRAGAADPISGLTDASRRGAPGRARRAAKKASEWRRST